MTPLIEIDKRINRTKAVILAKAEYLNPSGSVKDRIAEYMIEKAERAGRLKKGMEIVEVTTGNTGIAFAMAAAKRGYNFTAIAPATISAEKKAMLEALGAKLILTPAKQFVAGAVKRFEKIAKKANVWCPRQFENPDNIRAHYQTGKEILAQLKGRRPDIFVAGVGTGGTLMGVGTVLKKANPKLKIVAVEPAESAVLSGGRPGLHKIEGIGEGFIPKLLDLSFIDQIVRIPSDQAIAMAKKLAKIGLLVGPSSGANILAALKFAKNGKTIITILPDRGERYLKEIFNHKFGL
jgi:cysteine synthase A